MFRPLIRKEVGIFKSVFDLFNDTLECKDLVWQLFKRDFLMAYKKSFLGIGWHLIAPLISIISWVILNKAGVLNPGELTVPFPIYVLFGSTFWSLFIGVCEGARKTLESGNGFINQVGYPHHVLLVKEVLQQIATFSISFIIMLTVVSFMGYSPSLKIMCLPLLCFPIILLGTALGLFICVLAVAVPDISKAFSIVLNFFMYLSPIIFTMEGISENKLFYKIVYYNPLSHIVMGPRDFLLFGNLLDTQLYLIFSALTLFIFVLCFRFFYLVEQKLVEKMV